MLLINLSWSLRSTMVKAWVRWKYSAWVLRIFFYAVLFVACGLFSFQERHLFSLQTFTESLVSHFTLFFFLNLFNRRRILFLLLWNNKTHFAWCGYILPPTIHLAISYINIPFPSFKHWRIYDIRGSTNGFPLSLCNTSWGIDITCWLYFVWVTNQNEFMYGGISM